MNAHDVIELLDFLEQHGLDIVVDGGWGVDALLGEQTRQHQDLDIAIPESQVPALRALLSERGYAEVERDDSWACNFVLQDAAGRILDVHAYTLDANGRNVSGVPYEAHHLGGHGCIAGRAVRCIPAETMLAFHTGYAPDENDYHDVRLLCERFGLALPDGYRKV